MVVESIKTMQAHLTLEEKIRRLTPLSRSEFTNTALSLIAEGIEDKEWVRLFDEISVIPKTGDRSTIPNSMQLRLDDAAGNVLNENWLKAQCALSKAHRLSRLRKQVFILLVWQYYYDFLKKEKHTVISETPSVSGLSEMFGTLAELVLLNREQDQDTIRQIQELLSEWKNQVSDMPASVQEKKPQPGGFLFE